MATRALTLRTGDARDIALVEGVMAGAFDPRYGEAWTRNQCLGILGMPGVRLTLAYSDDSVAGFALVRTIMDEAELLLLAVPPDFCRRGVGAALLRGVIADCADRGGRVVHLEVRDGNSAVSLYARAGFARVGIRRGYYRGANGQAHDAHSYRLELISG